MTQSPTSSKQKVVTELRRSEIIAAATQVFGSKGFDDTLMEEIAHAAGLAKGTLYLYFKSKDDIYQAVVEQSIAELARLTRELVDAESTFAARYAAFIRVRIAFWREHQLIYRVILSMSRAPAYRKKSIAWQSTAVEYLAHMLQQAAEEGIIAQQDFIASAWTTMDAIRGCNERRVFSEETCRTIEEDTAFLTAFLFRAIGLPSTE